MPSLSPDYEYDIFISYRHNDNRSGWVTGFVKSLKDELATTLKESVSIYFDSNRHDGLLETHDVDKSLEGKLKSLILIPIISQTYCDTNSFAWKHEFCSFNKLSKEDLFGRDIKLSNGNVSSRILPIKIHDLDKEDQSILEAEIEGVLRGVDFIFSQPGVNRPLTSIDQQSENLNKTDYRNQLNKVAHAVKEVLYAMVKPEAALSTRSALGSKKEETKDTRPGIAVLPFQNRSKNPEQEYFSDGITENIIIELAANKNVRVISRTSMMRYKDTSKTAPEIAGELSVNYILEGGVQTSGNQVRINVQLVDAKMDELIWSKVFLESLDDIFQIQSDVATVVAKELHASMDKTSNDSVPTQNLEAYNYYLKGRHAFNQWGVQGYQIATDYFKKAIELDPEFKQAYSSLASSYSARMSWNGDMRPDEALPQLEKHLAEAWKRGPSENDYLTRTYVAFFLEKDFEKAEDHVKKALQLNENYPDAMYAYSYLLNMTGRFEEAQQWVSKAREIDPLTIPYFNFQTICHFVAGKYDLALEVINEGLNLYPNVLRFYDYKSRIQLAKEDITEANQTIQSGFKVSNHRPGSMMAHQAIAFHTLGSNVDRDKLINELHQKSANNERAINIYLTYVYGALKDFQKAEEWLVKAKETNDVGLIWFEVDPQLKRFREYLKQESTNEPDFEGGEKYILTLLKDKMPDLPYHNFDHVMDVAGAAVTLGEAEGLSTRELKLVRIAALLHDIGFIETSKLPTNSSDGHEAIGARQARELLPKFGFGRESIKTISQMILATKIPQTPKNKLDQVLCDADLDYLGRDDFKQIGDRLFEELKNQGVVESEREWNLVQKTFLESHRYHTNHSIQLRKPRKMEHLKQITEKLRVRQT